MLSSALKIFICTADCGSFAKASEKLYISATAVMKQINSFEDRLGFKLFERTSHGVRLTKAGEIIYRQGKVISQLADDAVMDARKTTEESSYILRVGSSLLNPCKPFMDLWYSVSDKLPQLKISIVPFDDDHSGILSVIERIGRDFDFIVGVCDSRTWLEMCRFFKLGEYRKCIAVPIGHRLAKKKKLKLADLCGETLVMVKAGDSPVNDNIRKYLTENHPDIKIEDAERHYDISVYNKCVSEGKLLLNTECWKDIHPALVTLPVEWDFTIPYGLLYAKEPSAEVQLFIDAVK